MEPRASFDFSFKKGDAEKRLREWLGSGAGSIQDQNEVVVLNVRRIRIPAVKVLVSYSVTWSADIGDLNESTYNIANMEHAVSLRKYNSLNEEERKKSIAPLAPSKSSHMTYTKNTGIYNDTIIYETTTHFNTAIYNVSKDEKANIDAVCAGINPDYYEYLEYSKLLSGADNMGGHEDEPETITSYREKEIYVDLCEKTTKIVAGKIRSNVMSGKEYRNLSITPVEPDGANYRFHIEYFFHYPTCLISYTWRNKRFSCAIDGRDINVIKGEKAHRGVIERTGKAIWSAGVAVNHVIDNVADAAGEAAAQALESAADKIKTWWRGHK